MPLPIHLRLAAACCLTAAVLFGQAAPPRIFQPPPEEPAPAQQQPAQPQAAQPPAAPGTQPAQPRLADSRGFLLGGVALSEMVDILAKMLKINYILDPRVKGSVTIYTYGEVKPVDLMPLMQTILRVNGATMVQVGDLYRIVPINAVSQLPLDPVMNADPKTLPDDERMLMNLIFLKYATAVDMDKLLKPFYGEGASSSVYEPGNLLILQDNSRSMKRTMELVAMFDSDTLASQRVQLFEITNSRPSDLVKELESIFKAYALSEKSTSVKFLPIDRINTVIAVAPNPGVFADVAKWIEKLDLPVQITAGTVTNYVYRLKYGRAETLAMAIMALYSGNTMALAAMASMMGSGGMGGGMYGGGMGMYGGGGGMYGGGGGAYGGMGAYQQMGYPMQPVNGAYGAYSTTASPGPPSATVPVSPALGANANPAAVNSGNQTGMYLGSVAPGSDQGQRIPHIVPNPFDNTLLVQGTPQEWEQINGLLRQLDVPPRQVLIDAKIYELDLKGAFSSGIQAYLVKKGTGPFSRTLQAASNGGMVMSAGALVLRSHELLGAISVAELNQQSRVISSPSIIATDSIPAVMNVGQDVPVLTSSGVAVTGSSYNSVSNRSTGTTLSIMARVNSSGVVTMNVDQDVSEAQTNSSSNISSPSFSRRSFSTTVTVQDGETIAIGGFIQETKAQESSGVPVLHRLPVIGGAFGSKTYTKARTELIIFLTPRVIYDTNQIQDATEEIRGRLKKLQNALQY
jgi:general secretion pathway protein D